MDDLNDYAYFARIVEHGGLSAASRATGIAKSRLSRRLTELEKRLQVRLLERSSRNIALTDIGRKVYEHSRAMEEEADAARSLAAYARSEPTGTVRIACPAGMLGCGISRILLRYMEIYPSVSLRIVTTNRKVDLVAEGFHVALRARSLPLEPSGLVMKKLGEATQCLVASSGFAAAHPVNDLDALAALPSLAHGRPAEDHVWRFEGNGAPRTVAHTPRLTVDDFPTLVTALHAGMGVAAMPYVTIAEDLDSGALVELLPEFPLEKDFVHAVFPSRQGMLPSVRHLLDYLAADGKVFERMQQRSVPLEEQAST
jgi:DNA-binding transcriptional LysR family regulator